MHRQLLSAIIVFGFLSACEDVRIAPAMPARAVSLGGDLGSGASFEEARRLSSLRGCSFETREVIRSDRSEDAPARKSRVQINARADGCRHLGLRGDLELEFGNDRLMTVTFVPDDFADYKAALEREIRQTIEIGESYDFGGVQVLVGERDGEVTVVWTDIELQMWFTSP